MTIQVAIGIPQQDVVKAWLLFETCLGKPKKQESLILLIRIQQEGEGCIMQSTQRIGEEHGL